MKALNILLKILHFLVILASAGLIVYITHETLNGISFLQDKQYLNAQFWACMLFLLDIAVEFIASPRKGRYVLTHLFFFFISIPYLNIISHFGINLSTGFAYLLHFIPMIRAGYILSLVSGAITSSDRVKSLFTVYLILLAASIYFCSLVFYIEEHPVNPGVTSFWISIWWAILNSTTTGSNIISMTPTGDALDIILSAEGFILYPLFTVYITNLLNRSKRGGHTAGADNSAPATN